MVGELLQRARVEESIALMERKADVEDVNRHDRTGEVAEVCRRISC